MLRFDMTARGPVDEVRRLAEQRELSDTSTKILLWIGREAVLSGNPGIDDSDLLREIQRLGHELGRAEDDA